MKKTYERSLFMDDLKPVIAKNITDLRKAADMTQAQLAEKLNYSDKAVSKWERGDAIPGVITLKEVADLFGVTVDYLLTEEHTAEKEIKREFTKRQRRNHLIISLLSTMTVWLAATIIYVSISLSTLFGLPEAWLAFVFAVPASCIILLIFNSIWGKVKRNFVIITIFLWSLLVSLCLTFFFVSGESHIWLLLAVGIPLQIMILLWSGLKQKKKVK